MSTRCPVGLAQVALSNAIGAQIVNIALGLGLPWLIMRARDITVEIEMERDIAALEIAVG